TGNLLRNSCNECDPEPAEICNGRDDNCDGQIDEGVTNACGECGPVPVELCNFEDDDCDSVVDLPSCDADDDGDGLTPRQGDCDDSAANVGWGAPEECDNGIDESCDGFADWPGC